MRKSGLKVRARLVASAAMVAISAGAALAEAETAVDISLPEQPLAKSLTYLSQRMGENILFRSDITAGVRAPALNGRMTSRQAIEKLIHGTGLRVGSDGRGGVILERESFSAPLPATSPAPRQQYVQLAQADTAPQPQADAGIEQVVVSGSRVTIAGYSQPTPVTVIGIAQLEQNAYASIQDSISVLPMVTSAPASFNNINGLGGGGSSQNNVNLRDLGGARTLVLFDNQRVTITGMKGSVDTTTLPSSMIQRVDVVTGGASAAWGSDAVAGVVNFVINKNFTGFKATVQGSSTYNGLYRNAFAEAAWGDDIFGGRGHIEFAANANYRPDTVLLGQEKWFKGAYWVSNPAYVAGNGQPQLIMATNVGLANVTEGGIINSSPAGVAGPGITPAPANALRGIEFVSNGIPQLVNYGNLTQGALSNGGSLNKSNTWAPLSPIAMRNNSYTFFGYGRYKLTDAIQASVQLNYSYVTALATSGPNIQTALTIKSDNAYIPAPIRATMQAGGITSFTLGTFNVNNLDMNNPSGPAWTQATQSGLGPIYAANRRNFLRGVFALDGTLGSDWSWNAYVQHSEIRYSTHMGGVSINANRDAAQDAVTVTTANRGTSGLPLGSIVCRSSLTGVRPVVNGITAQNGCVPLNLFGNGVASPAAIAYITGQSTGSVDANHEHNQQDTAEFSMQGTLPWELPAGKVAVAFGAGYRVESGWQDNGPIGNRLGYYSGVFPYYPHVHYNVAEGFGEVDAPILKDGIVNSLDFSAAGRITSYSTSGLVETWKLGATSQVNDDIKLRVSWSLDIRAPQLDDLYKPGSVNPTTQVDPKSHLSVTTNTNATGNINLKPEVARTVSGGVVLTPTFIPGLSLSADWYSINIADVIAGLSAPIILAACNDQLPSPTNPGHNGSLSDPLCAQLEFNGPGGALSNINISAANFANQTTSGLDLQLNYSHDFLDGTLSWASTASYMSDNTTTGPGLPASDIAGSNDLALGTIGNQYSPGPKWRGIVAATYNAGPYSFTVQSRWFGTSKTYRNGNTGNQATAATANLYDPAHYMVPFSAYLDLRGNYKWNDNISFFGAIDNTLNTPPPLVLPLTGGSSSGGAGFYNTNFNVYDMLGRTFRMGVRFNY